MSRVDNLIKDLGGHAEALKFLGWKDGTHAEVSRQLARRFNGRTIMRKTNTGFFNIELEGENRWS